MTRRRFHAAGLLLQALLLFGSWKLNPSKSSLGGPPPREQGVTFERSGADGIFAIEDTVYADGTRTTIRYTAKVDGKDYPIIGSREIIDRADTVSLTRVNATTMTWTYRKNGKTVLSVPGVLSPDGRTLTMNASENRVLVYDKAR